MLGTTAPRTWGSDLVCDLWLPNFLRMCQPLSSRTGSVIAAFASPMTWLRISGRRSGSATQPISPSRSAVAASSETLWASAAKSAPGCFAFSTSSSFLRAVPSRLAGVLSHCDDDLCELESARNQKGGDVRVIDGLDIRFARISLWLRGDGLEIGLDDLVFPLPRKLGRDGRLLVPFLAQRFLEHKAVGKDGAPSLAKQRRIVRHRGLLSTIQRCERRTQLFGGDIALSYPGDDFAGLHRRTIVRGGRGCRLSRRRRTGRSGRGRCVASRGWLRRPAVLRDPIRSDGRE